LLTALHGKGKQRGHRRAASSPGPHVSGPRGRCIGIRWASVVEPALLLPSLGEEARPLVSGAKRMYGSHTPGGGDARAGRRHGAYTPRSPHAPQRSHPPERDKRRHSLLSCGAQASDTKSDTERPRAMIRGVTAKQIQSPRAYNPGFASGLRASTGRVDPGPRVLRGGSAGAFGMPVAWTQPGSLGGSASPSSRRFRLG
jgi:hypothetical protein